MNKTALIFTSGLLGLFSLNASAENANFRPKHKTPTFGLGVGMSVPSSGLDTFIYRIRINADLMIEPMITGGSTTTETTTNIEQQATDADGIPQVDDDGNAVMETISSTSEVNSSFLGGGLHLRYRVAKRHNTDLQVIGGVGYVRNTTEETVVGVQGSEEEEASSLSANLGVGVESFFAPKWSAGVDVTTPVYTQITSSASTNGIENNNGTATGLGFTPTFRLMLTHYF